MVCFGLASARLGIRRLLSFGANSGKHIVCRCFAASAGRNETDGSRVVPSYPAAPPTYPPAPPHRQSPSKRKPVSVWGTDSDDTYTRPRTGVRGSLSKQRPLPVNDADRPCTFCKIASERSRAYPKSRGCAIRSEVSVGSAHRVTTAPSLPMLMLISASNVYLPEMSALWVP